MSAKVRMHLAHGERMSEEIKPFERMFLGNGVGVVIRKRGPNDPHICFEIISEDDEYWFPYTGNGSSSYWFDDYIRVLAEAKKWCETKAMLHTNQYPDSPDIPCGWRFKTPEELRKEPT